MPTKDERKLLRRPFHLATVPVEGSMNHVADAIMNTLRQLSKGVCAIVIVVAFASLPQAWAGDNGYAAIGGQGADLTKYLHAHRLPLVTGQLIADPNGGRQVVLSGFTATEFGRQDAATKTRHFLNDNTIAITNRIKVRPELQSQTRSSRRPPADTGTETSGDGSGPDVNPDASSQSANPDASSQPANPNSANYQNQSQRDIQSYAAQQQQAYRQQQPGMGGMGGGGTGLTFGNGGMSMSMGGGGLGALLGLLGGAGGSPSYGPGSSGNGYGSGGGYSSQGYGTPSYGPGGYGSSGYSSQGYGSPGYGSSPYGPPQGYPPTGP